MIAFLFIYIIYIFYCCLRHGILHYVYMHMYSMYLYIYICVCVYIYIYIYIYIAQIYVRCLTYIYIRCAPVPLAAKRDPTSRQMDWFSEKGK